MYRLLLSLLLVPFTSQARSIQLPTDIHHYAEIVDIQMDNGYPVSFGTVTYMQGCGDSKPTVELSKPMNIRNVSTVKLRVQLTTRMVAAVCLAMPSEQHLNFTVNTFDGPVAVIADSNFNEVNADVLHANLDKFYFQAGSNLERAGIQSGTIKVDQIKKELTLTMIRPGITCPKGVFCIAGGMPSKPIEVIVPLQATSVGNCQETIYEGSVDQTPVDGNLTEIRVVDNRTNICESARPFPATEVQLHYRGGRPAFEEFHTLEGEGLLK